MVETRKTGLVAPPTSQRLQVFDILLMDYQGLLYT